MKIKICDVCDSQFEPDERLIEEMADLVYHSLVLLESRNLKWSDVVATLEKRHR